MIRLESIGFCSTKFVLLIDSSGHVAHNVNVSRQYLFKRVWTDSFYSSKKVLGSNNKNWRKFEAIKLEKQERPWWSCLKLRLSICLTKMNVSAHLKKHPKSRTTVLISPTGRTILSKHLYHLKNGLECRSWIRSLQTMWITGCEKQKILFLRRNQIFAVKGLVAFAAIQFVPLCFSAFGRTRKICTDSVPQNYPNKHIWLIKDTK